MVWGSGGYFFYLFDRFQGMMLVLLGFMVFLHYRGLRRRVKDE